MFSATWPPEVRELAMSFCRTDPVQVNIGEVGNKINVNITQVVRCMQETEKYDR